MGFGVPIHPLENQKAVGFHRYTSPNLLENYKATEPAYNVGR